MVIIVIVTTTKIGSFGSVQYNVFAPVKDPKGGWLISGSFRGTADQFRITVHGAVRLAVRKGGNRALGFLEPKIALDSKDMRKAIVNITNNIIVGFTPQGRFALDVKEDIFFRAIASVFYTEFHIDTGPTGLPFYKFPTTAGTTPLKSKEWVDTFVDFIAFDLRKELKLRGFDYS